jgi:hypothetical protein
VSTLIEERPKHSWKSAIIRRLVELGIVFVGVYAAFALNNHQSHKQERQRRAQINGRLDSRASSSAISTRVYVHHTVMNIVAS